MAKNLVNSTNIEVNVSGDDLSLDFTETGQVATNNANINNLLPVTLFENSTGTTDDITLSQSCANFKYIEIYYYSADKDGYTDKGQFSVKAYNPNGTNVTLFFVGMQGTIYHNRYCQLSFSGTTATHGSEKYGNIIHSGTSTTGTSGTKLFMITRIIGYK